MTTVSPEPRGRRGWRRPGARRAEQSPKHVQRGFIQRALPAEVVVIREERRAGVRHSRRWASRRHPTTRGVAGVPGSRFPQSAASRSRQVVAERAQRGGRLGAASSESASSASTRRAHRARGSAGVRRASRGGGPQEVGDDLGGQPVDAQLRLASRASASAVSEQRRETRRVLERSAFVVEMVGGGRPAAREKGFAPSASHRLERHAGLFDLGAASRKSRAAAASSSSANAT